MNEVFLIGKVITDVNFNFIIESKHNSIVEFKIKTLDNQVLNIRTYDELADFAYSKLKKDSIVFIYGNLIKNYIIVKYLKNFEQ